MLELFFLTASILEIGQKFDWPIAFFAGTYDPWDFMAYGVGAGLAIGIDALTFRKKNLESLVNENLVEGTIQNVSDSKPLASCSDPSITH